MTRNHLLSLTALPILAVATTGGGYVVEWRGEMRRVMREGDLTDRFSLAGLKDKPNVYGLGPLSGLRGEITVFGSKPYVATVDRARDVPDVSHGFDYRAPFFVWAHVERWQEVKLGEGVADLKALEEVVFERAKAAGLDTSRPFPFLVKGMAVHAQYHVLDRQGDAPHSHEQHERIKVRYPLLGVPLEAIGFWSDRHQGVWTHHGERVHVHMRVETGKGSGHLDAVRFAPGATLSFPKAR